MYAWERGVTCLWRVASEDRHSKFSAAGPDTGSRSLWPSRRSLRPDYFVRTTHPDGGRSFCYKIEANSTGDSVETICRRSADGLYGARSCRRFQSGASFMAQDAQAPVRRISFHFQHLGLSKLRQTGIGEVERHGDAGDTIGSKPLA